MEDDLLEIKLHKRYGSIYPDYTENSGSVSKLLAKEMASLLDVVASIKFGVNAGSFQKETFCVNFLEIGDA